MTDHLLHLQPLLPPILGVIGTAAALIGSALLGVGGSLVAANQTKKALQGAQGIADRLTYEPIDINKVKQEAADAAVQNATQSLALERSLQPDVADTRANLSKSISDQLKLGGRVPADIANQVAQAARVSGGASGGFGGTPGVTAGLLGTTALNLLNQRQSNAAGLLAANPLPASGLSPSEIANLEIANTNSQNQFNAAKAGVATNLLNSNAQSNAGTIGSVAGGLSNLIGLAGLLNGGTVNSGLTNSYVPASPASIGAGATFGNGLTPGSIGTYNASLIPGGCWVARSVYGNENPRWLLFRAWLFTMAPAWFRNLYLRHGERFAAWLDRHAFLKPAIRRWMETRIALLPA